MKDSPNTQYKLLKYTIRQDNSRPPSGVNGAGGLGKGRIQGITSNNVYETLDTRTRAQANPMTIMNTTYNLTDGHRQSGYVGFRLYCDQTYSNTGAIQTGGQANTGFNLNGLRYYVVEIQNEYNYKFKCPDLSNITPKGFKPYIYLGEPR